MFGWFDGPGLQGAAGMVESLGFRPGRPWAAVASLAELVGGILIVFGFLNPLGPLMAACSMMVAAFRAHWGKPVWVTSGGAELPLTNLAALAAIALAGPGRVSLDYLWRSSIPGTWALFASVIALGVTFMAIIQSHMVTRPAEPAPARMREQARVSETVASAPETEQREASEV